MDRGSVELNVTEQRVDVWAHHAEGSAGRARVRGRLALYDHTEERTWRHLDSCQFMTYLHARPPRVDCPTHGVRQVRLPWAEPKARFTSLFERLAIDVLQETDILGATRILRISWDEAWHILERAVERGQRAKGARVTPHLGVDEKAIAKGHQYLTLVCDLDRARWNTSRRTASRRAWLPTSRACRPSNAPASRRSPWTCGSRTCGHPRPCPRGREQDRLRPLPHHEAHGAGRGRRAQAGAPRSAAAGDDTLSGSKYLWLYAEENLPEQHRERFAELGHRPQDRPRVGDQGESARALGLHPGGLGRTPLEALVLLGDPLAPAPVIEAAQ